MRQASKPREDVYTDEPLLYEVWLVGNTTTRMENAKYFQSKSHPSVPLSGLLSHEPRSKQFVGAAEREFSDAADTTNHGVWNSVVWA